MLKSIKDFILKPWVQNIELRAEIAALNKRLDDCIAEAGTLRRENEILKARGVQIGDTRYGEGQDYKYDSSPDNETDNERK